MSIAGRPDLISPEAHRRFWRWAFSLKCAALRAIPARFNLLHTLPGFFSGVVAIPVFNQKTVFEPHEEP
jgi:hypothetical protein